MTAAKVHAILGASAGLGFTYAEHMARRGDRFVLVSRRPRALSAAARRLERAGAVSVEVLMGDLLDRSFRRNLLRRARGRSLDSVFIGGPSPPPGSLETLRHVDFHRGLEAAFIYPLEVARWCVAGGVKDGGSVIVISSAAVSRPLDVNNQFFISNLFRTPLEKAVKDIGTDRVRIQVWRPEVVLTPLALTYARRHRQACESASETLRRLCGVEYVPSADEFVAAMLNDHD